MGAPAKHRPTLLVAAVTAGDVSAIDWARETATAEWGPLAFESELFTFDQTTYYESSMGPNLSKRLLAFSALIDPAKIVEAKLKSNRWEQDYCEVSASQVERPVNIDPGYVTEAKLVLATTKDRDHRIYLDRGIFAEVTLFFRKGGWQSRPWTYADYQQPGYHRFLDRCRHYLRDRYKDLSSLDESG